LGRIFGRWATTTGSGVVPCPINVAIDA